MLAFKHKRKKENNKNDFKGIQERTLTNEKYNAMDAEKRQEEVNMDQQGEQEERGHISN